MADSKRIYQALLNESQRGEVTQKNERVVSPHIWDAHEAPFWCRRRSVAQRGICAATFPEFGFGNGGRNLVVEFSIANGSWEKLSRIMDAIGQVFESNQILMAKESIRGFFWRSDYKFLPKIYDCSRLDGSSYLSILDSIKDSMQESKKDDYGRMCYEVVIIIEPDAKIKIYNIFSYSVVDGSSRNKFIEELANRLTSPSHAEKWSMGKMGPARRFESPNYGTAPQLELKFTQFSPYIPTIKTIFSEHHDLLASKKYTISRRGSWENLKTNLWQYGITPSNFAISAFIETLGAFSANDSFSVLVTASSRYRHGKTSEVEFGNENTVLFLTHVDDQESYLVTMRRHQNALIDQIDDEDGYARIQKINKLRGFGLVPRYLIGINSLLEYGNPVFGRSKSVLSLERSMNGLRLESQNSMPHATLLCPLVIEDDEGNLVFNIRFVERIISRDIIDKMMEYLSLTINYFTYDFAKRLLMSRREIALQVASNMTKWQVSCNGRRNANSAQRRGDSSARGTQSIDHEYGQTLCYELPRKNGLVKGGSECGNGTTGSSTNMGRSYAMDAAVAESGFAWMVGKELLVRRECSENRLRYRPRASKSKRLFGARLGGANGSGSDICSWQNIRRLSKFYFANDECEAFDVRSYAGLLKILRSGQDVSFAFGENYSRRILIRTQFTDEPHLVRHLVEICGEGELTVRRDFGHINFIDVPGRLYCNEKCVDVDSRIIGANILSGMMEEIGSRLDIIAVNDGNGIAFMGLVEKNIAISHSLLAMCDIVNEIGSWKCIEECYFARTGKYSDRYAIHIGTEKLEIRVRSCIKNFISRCFDRMIMPTILFTGKSRPRSDISDGIRSIVRRSWINVLGRAINEERDFFESGGDSLGLIELLNSLSLGKSRGLIMQEFLAKPTLDNLVELVSNYAS